MEYSVLVPYIAGTLIGVLIGHGLGLRRGATVTMDMLIETGFLKYKKNSKGEVEILKPE